jgi:hypothetical protein
MLITQLSHTHNKGKRKEKGINKQIISPNGIIVLAKQSTKGEKICYDYYARRIQN